MGVRLLLFLLSTAVGAFAGDLYRRYLAERRRYFGEYRRFLRYVGSDLGFRRTDIMTLTGGFDTADALFKKHLSEYADGLKSGVARLSGGYLSREELETVKSTLFSIGRVDAETQIAELKAAESDADERFRAAERKYLKYGVTAVKLGLLGGIGLGILLL